MGLRSEKKFLLSRTAVDKAGECFLDAAYRGLDPDAELASCAENISRIKQFQQCRFAEVLDFRRGAL